MPRHQQPGPSNHPREPWWRTPAIIAALIAGTASILTAVLAAVVTGLFGLMDNKPPTTQGPVSGPTFSGSSTTTVGSTMQSPTTVATSTTEPPRRTYRVRLASQEALDLDTGRKSGADSSDFELTRTGGNHNQLAFNNETGAFPIGRELSKDNCSSAIDSAGGEGQSDFNYQDMSNGLVLCTVTSESRIVGIITTKPLTDTSPIPMEIIVW
jgi:hypothetical protein